MQQIGRLNYIGRNVGATSSRIVQSYMSKVIGMNPIIYFPLNEGAGTNATNYGTLGAAANGTYVGPTLNQIGIGDGNTSVSFDGGDYVEVFSAALAGAFNGEEGTFSCYIKPADWYGAVQGLGEFYTDGNNFVRFYGSNNLCLFHYTLGHWSDPATYTLDDLTGKWIHYIATWSYSSNIVKVYLDGILMAQKSANIDHWVGALAWAHLGNSTPGNFRGCMAHAALWNSVLTDTQILTLSNYSNELFGGVLITFDDIFADSWNGVHYCVNNGIHGTEFVASYEIDIGGYFTHENLQEMDAAGWTIGNHTMNHATLSVMSEAQQIVEIQGCKDALAAFGLMDGIHFAFPYGGSNQNASTPAAFTACGIVTARVTELQQSIDTKLVNNYWLPMQFYVNHNHTLEQIKASVNLSRAVGGYWQCLFHGLSVGWSANPEKWDINLFYQFIDWLIAEEIPCLSHKEFYALM